MSNKKFAPEKGELAAPSGTGPERQSVQQTSGPARTGRAETEKTSQKEPSTGEPVSPVSPARKTKRGASAEMHSPDAAFPVPRVRIRTAAEDPERPLRRMRRGEGSRSVSAAGSWRGARRSCSGTGTEETAPGGTRKAPTVQAKRNDAKRADRRKRKTPSPLLPVSVFWRCDNFSISLIYTVQAEMSRKKLISPGPAGRPRRRRGRRGD